MRFARFIFISACLLTSGLAAADMAAFCREKRLDCAELSEAVAAITTTGRLPEKFITKKQAKKLGWNPGYDLATIAPGKSIGGDRFGNFERRLPIKKGRQWFEADLSFKGGKRGAKRLLYSSDRLIYVTVDHYKTFQQVPQ
jgi:guanyl-specific ribonuclease Sa